MAAERDLSKGFIDRDVAIRAAGKVTKAKYPDADEVTVDRALKIRYKADGSYVQWAETYTKILTEKARRNNSTLSSHFTIPYQRGPEDCKVSLVEIIKPGGKIVTIDVKSNSKLMINPRGMGANIFNPNCKVIRVNIPGIKIGDTLHYVMYDRTVQPRVKNTYCSWNSFEGRHPIIRASVEIRGPKSLPLRCIAIKGRVGKTLKQYKTVEENGELIYRWEARNVGRMFPEPKMPGQYMVTQRVLSSTVADWKTLSKWYWDISQRHYAHTPEMKAKVEQLVKGITNPQKKIEAIFQYVSQKIRYMGITTETESPGYEPHDVKDTFNQKHGVCRDKAALLVVMLRLAGFEAFPVIIHNGAKKDVEVPQPYFNHAITAIREKDGSYMLMDSTDENTRRLLPSYLNNKSYLVATPQGDTLRTSAIIPAEKNLMRINTAGRIDASGNLKARTTLRFEGINDNRYRGWFSRIKPEVRRRYFEGLVKRAAAGARITSIDIEPKNMLDTSKPLTVRLGYEAKNITISGKDNMMLPIPAIGAKVGMVNFIIRSTGLKKRKYPLMSGIACGVHESVDLEVAAELGDVAAMPNYTPVDNDAMSWKFSLSAKGRKFRAESDFRLKIVEFSPKQYLVLKDTLKKIEYDRRKMLIFKDGKATVKKKAISDIIFEPQQQPQMINDTGDVLVLDSNTQIDLIDVHNWTETYYAKIKVRTYAGKKHFSELKIPFNPVWDKVELVKAVVYKSDGTQRKISDKEINIMDAGEGTAPRYPVSKIFIASLPGVEVGSVIEYQYKVTRKGHPFFAFNSSLQGFDVIRKKTVRVIAPKNIKLRTKLINQLKPGLEIAWSSGDTTKTNFVESKFISDGNRAGCEWWANYITSLKREDMLGPMWSFTPTVFASAGEFESYAASIHKILIKNVANQSQAERKARELVAKASSPIEKLKILRDFVVLNVRAVGPGLTGMPLRYITSADVTLKDGYGNTTDRAILLHAMLKAVGFEPQFVLASKSPRIARLRKIILKSPNPRLFPTVLVRVKVKGTQIYLNDTSQYSALGATAHDGRAGLVLPSGNVETISASAGMSGKTRISYTITIKENGDALICRKQRFYGRQFGAMNHMFSEMTPEARRRYHQKMVASISQAAIAEGELKTDFADYPGVQEFSVKVEKFAVRDGDYLYCRLPESLAGLFAFRADTRSNPLYLAHPRKANVETIIVCPSEFKPVMLPKRIYWRTNTAGSVSLTTKDKGRGTLTITAKSNVSPTMIRSREYPKWLELKRKLSHPGANIILLKKTRK